EFGELRQELIVDGAAKLLGAANLLAAFVEDAIGSEKLEDGFAAALIPDFVEPAEQELFVLFGG
ncbi:MAG TPA: hypothetical protein VL128_17300, partial [Candidatus Eisenbacteria bacterium]|nr:hypothetical protein [Candidatus Eisenbacteria bacterium]